MLEKKHAQLMKSKATVGITSEESEKKKLFQGIRNYFESQS